MTALPAETPMPDTEELERRRAAIAALGHELRTLVETAVTTVAPIPAVDEFPGGVRMYSPVTGHGSPLAPPMRVTREGDGVVGRCMLGIAHEGPPGYVHGGMSAMLLDELMGWACYAAESPAMTVSLEMRYHRPVPLQTPLRVHARVTGTEDRKIRVAGSISTEQDPSVALVTADAVFVSPDLGRARTLFPGS